MQKTMATEAKATQSHYDSHRPDYNRGLTCLTCGKPLQNRSKTDYCAKHLPRRMLAKDFIW